MLDRILRQHEVAETIGCSRGHLWRLVSQQRFPPPYKLGKRAVGWKSSEVESWLDSLQQRNEVGG